MIDLPIMRNHQSPPPSPPSRFHLHARRSKGQPTAPNTPAPHQQAAGAQPPAPSAPPQQAAAAPAAPSAPPAPPPKPSPVSLQQAEALGNNQGACRDAAQQMRRAG